MLDEAERALADQVVANADHVDAGVIFGTGFAPFRGGPLHYRRKKRRRRGGDCRCGIAERGRRDQWRKLRSGGLRCWAGSRIPFCRSHTAYAELSNLDMLIVSLGGLIDRFALHGAHIDEVVGGAVVTHAKDWNLAREAVIGSALAPTTPAITMMQACGTSLAGALSLGAKIATGQIECGIALGTDTTSDAPVVFQRRFAQRLVQAVARQGLRPEARRLQGLHPGRARPPAAFDLGASHGLGMGEHCELMAKEWGITREAQDLLAYESHKKAAAAYDEGFMDDLVVPCAGVFRDNNIRADISLGKMAELKPVFDRSGRARLLRPIPRR